MSEIVFFHKVASETTALTQTNPVDTSGPAAAGNLLVATQWIRLGGDSFTTPPGYTAVETVTGTNAGFQLCIKIATSSDDHVANWVDDGRPTSTIIEVSGLKNTLIDSASDDSAILNTNPVASITTGTATPTSGDNGLAVAFLARYGGGRWCDDVDGAGLTITDGFQIVDYNTARNSDNTASIAVAVKAYTDNAPISATWSSDSVGLVTTQCAAAIVLFDEAGAAFTEIFDVGSTVELIAGTAQVDGSGDVISAVITSSGALIAQSAEIDGTAEREITGQGSLVTIASVVSASAEVAGVIDSAGALSAESASIAGIAEREINASGALSAESAQVDGTGAVDSAIEITGSGALVADPATVSGSAEVQGATNGAGDLVSDSATVSGAGIRQVNGSGSLAANSAQVDGTAERQILSSGALDAQPATIDGLGIAGESIGAAGELQAQDSAVQGTGSREITGQGSLVSAPATVSGVGSGIRQIVGTGTLSANEAVVSGSGFRTVYAIGDIQSGPATVYGYDVFEAADWVYTVGEEKRVFYVKKESRLYNVAKRTA